MNIRPVRVIAAAASVCGLAAAAYPSLRRWWLTWGASPEEVTGVIPGDELMPQPDILATRAVTIAAPPGAIWPWLVQMGSGRGGVYTYDWIENLFGLDMHSADEILPQFQDIKLGDEYPLGRTGPRMRVAVLTPERVLGLQSTDGNWVWLFALFPHNGGTRLVSRNRIRTPGASRVRRTVYQLVMEPGSLIMERKMLLGIKQRAEQLV